MTLHENESDRQRQTRAAKTLLAHLAGLPFMEGTVSVKETSQAGAQSHDLEVYVQEHLIGVGEIKCLNHTEETIKKNGYLINKHTLTSLRKWEDRGYPVMLIFKTSDGPHRYIMLRALMDHPHLLTAAPRSWMKDDHGQKDSAKEGFLIPVTAAHVLNKQF